MEEELEAKKQAGKKQDVPVWHCPEGLAANKDVFTREYLGVREENSTTFLKSVMKRAKAEEEERIT